MTGKLQQNGRYGKPIWKGLKIILAKDWNIKQPSCCGGDMLGNECQKLMSMARHFLTKLRHSYSKDSKQMKVHQSKKREKRRKVRHCHQSFAVV